MAVFNNYKFVQDTLFGFLGWVLVGPPIIIPTYIFMAVACLFVHILAKIFRSDLLPISRIDALVTFAPSYTPGYSLHGCQVWKVSGEVSAESFRKHFYNIFLCKEEDRKLYGNLYCYFVNFLGYTFKKKVDKLDLNYHIQELQLNDGESVEGFLGKWIVSTDSDSGEKKPDWMVKVIPPHGKDLTTTILFKLHHGLCDGYTIVHLVGKLSGEHAPYLFKDPLPPFSKKLQCLIQWPYRVAQLWFALYLYKKKNIQSQNAPPTDDGKEEEWFMSFSSLNLQTVKEIRRLTNTNYVSVLMSLQIGVLKRLLLELTTDTKKTHKVVNDIFIAHSMGWPGHPVMTSGGGMGNHLTLNTIRGSLKPEDPLLRLLEVDEGFKRTKEIGIPEMAWYALNTMMKLQPSFFSRLIFRSFTFFAMETGLSTLLCSSNPHKLLGNTVDNLYLPVSTTAYRQTKMVIVPVSHSGKLDISILASSKLVKDQETLNRLTKVYFPQELEQLKRRLGEGT